MRNAGKRLRIGIVLCAFLSACESAPAPVGSVVLPDVRPRALVPSAMIEDPAVDESSGVAASRLRSGLFWTHNDSGGRSVLYAFDAEGRRVGSAVRIRGATNVDWEDIAADQEGNLWIADIGNNFNTRTDLRLYVLPEPDPLTQSEARVARTIRISYPDQSLFPPPRLEYDAEALFVVRDTPYIFTKHRGSTTTKLYRLDAAGEAGRSLPLTLMGTFDVGGMVTGADASADGRLVVVLTYTAVWLFETKSEGAWLDGGVRWLPIIALQCEGICFAPDGGIVITNEQRQIFRLMPEELIRVRD